MASSKTATTEASWHPRRSGSAESPCELSSAVAIRLVRPQQPRFPLVVSRDERRRGVGETGWRVAVSVGAKRIFDLVLASVLLVVLSPAMLLVVALIKLTSPGPALLVQRRIGYRCREFGMYKFRSMIPGAERDEERLAAMLPGRGFFKIEHDPRVTPLGRFLRKTSLDELPQLVNVLRGEMSLVGPRPLLLVDLRNYPHAIQARRFAVRPGLTGLWQVSGRSATSDGERIRLDLEYVDRWSLWLDLLVMARTLPAIISGKGAC